MVLRQIFTVHYTCMTTLCIIFHITLFDLHYTLHMHCIYFSAELKEEVVGGWEVLMQNSLGKHREHWVQQCWQNKWQKYLKGENIMHMGCPPRTWNSLFSDECWRQQYGRILHAPPRSHIYRGSIVRMAWIWKNWVQMTLLDIQRTTIGKGQHVSHFKFLSNLIYAKSSS